MAVLVRIFKTGFHLNGAWCSPIDLAPNFAATMMGLSGLCSYSLARLCTFGFLVPICVLMID